MQVIKYSSTDQFRHVCKEIKEGIIDFSGTVKLHGTNASVICTTTNLYAQSKNNIINKGHFGFVDWVSNNEEYFKDFRNNIGYDIVVYGEWCGKGIQKGTAISQLDKFFYVFGVKTVETGKWIKTYPKIKGTIDSRDFSYNIKIDFSNPTLAQNALIALTNQVEERCPVGYSLGIDGVGEGIVWEHICDTGRRFKFKVKGQKHSTSKVKN